MLQPQRLFTPRQCPLIQGLRLRQLSLLSAEHAQVVDRVQGQPVLRAQRLLVPRQRPLVHNLRLRQLPLILAEDAQVVDRVQRRCVLQPQRLSLPADPILISSSANTSVKSPLDSKS